MEPFLGEIRMFSYSWAPRGWALCNGAQLTIQQNQALYTLITNKYGGNGTTNFNLPDLRGQVPVSQGQSPVSSNIYNIGMKGGQETVTLTASQMPAHIHTTNVMDTTGNSAAPAGNLFAVPGQFKTNPVIPIYAPKGTNTPVALNTAVVGMSGGAPHSNMQPWAVTNYCIATSGLYPQRP